MSPSAQSRSSRSSLDRQSRSQNSHSSLQPLHHMSSGESSNAEEWFEQSNNAVSDKNTTFADGDPPFFMRKSASSETPQDGREQWRHSTMNPDNAASEPHYTGLLRLDTEGSSTADFRGVIDDLTIKNQKLKRRLKKYEKLHDSHLKDEKLFEVRVHGLPAEKKRELEETLRTFAASLQKITPSYTSAQPADSAYASMSASGQGSSSGPGGRPKPFAKPALSMQQNIQSYLNHSSEGLLPWPNPATMTERARKKLVVKRLEQIFAGRGAALTGHSHPLQQQEVSRLAAKAERSDVEAQGQRARIEGTREAHIMANETESPVYPKERQDSSPRDTTQPAAPMATVAVRDFAEHSVRQASPDQRPTRPLDLDLRRAQIPEDNLQYLRHFGFSPSELDSNASPEECHGWIYLNLLINMAQLHTINVTADFVIKALSDYSSMFEVSSDGCKVRWRGGRSLTRASSSGGDSSSPGSASERASGGESPRKRQKLSRKAMHPGTQPATTQRLDSGNTDASDNKVMYTPMFFHRNSTDSTESSPEELDDSLSLPFLAMAAGRSSGITSSRMPTMSTKRKARREDGPIIFYNNARFCTDLSGDRVNASKNFSLPQYKRVTSLPIGQSCPVLNRRAYEKRGLLAAASELPEPMDLDENAIPAEMDLTFPQQSPPRPEQSYRQEPIQLEVSGIGGVRPADNFAINVESRHARHDDGIAPQAPRDVAPSKYPQRISDILRDSSQMPYRRSAHFELVVSAADREDFPPSELPPALMYMPCSDESITDGESDADDSMAEAPDSHGAFPPVTAPQAIDIRYTASDDDSEEEEDDADDESDSSLDLLATARRLDPESVRMQEREYDANMAERLADEIPAGSSAATAGGGSGFASPASAVTDMARGECHVGAPPSLKRRREGAE